MLQVGLDASPTVPVVIEKLSDFDTTYYDDGDEDGYGDPDSPNATPCVPPDGYGADDTDCDDVQPTVHPGAAEICDGLDNDCDGQSDEGQVCAPAAVPAVGSVFLGVGGLLLMAAGGFVLRTPKPRA